MSYMNVGEATEDPGVSVTTVFRWEKLGKSVPAHRTFEQHRRYSAEQCNA